MCVGRGGGSVPALVIVPVLVALVPDLVPVPVIVPVPPDPVLVPVLVLVLVPVPQVGGGCNLAWSGAGC